MMASGAEEAAKPGSSPAAEQTRNPESSPGAMEAPRRRTRVHRGELTSATSALLLLALMFLTKWYGIAGVPDPSAARPAISTAVNAWNGLSVVRWVMLITIGAALGSVGLHASQREHGTKTDTSRVLAALGSVTSALLVYRVLIDLPAASEVIDQKLGAILGLLCAFGIAVGGYESVRERKALAQRGMQQVRRRDRLDSEDRAR